MSERTATWRIVTEFAKARKDSDRLARSLDNLDRSKERLDDDTVLGDQKVEKSAKARTKATQEFVRQAKAANAEAEKTVTTTHDTTEALKKEDSVRKKSLGGVIKDIAARKVLARTKKEEAKSSSSLLAAETRLEQAELRRRAAVLALTAAEKRHADAVKKNGLFSDQAARTLLTVERRTLDLTHAEQQHSVALRRVADEQNRVSGGSGGLIGKLRSLAGEFDNVGKSAGGMMTLLNLLKFPALAAGIGNLLGLVSQLAAGILSLIGPLSTVAGLAASLPTALAIGGGVIGTFLAGFSGIGAALKANTAAQNAATKASASGTKAMNAQKAATQRLADAQKALNKAQKDAQELDAALERAANVRKAADQNAQNTLNDPNASAAQKAKAQQELVAAKKQEASLKKKDQLAHVRAAKAQDTVNRLQKQQQKAQSGVAGGTSAAATAANMYAAALAKLTPEGRAFVKVLLDAQKRLKDVKDAAQKGLLPGLGAAITTLLKLVPLVSKAIFEFGQIIGNTAKRGAKIMTSGPFTKMFGRILTSNEKILRMAGKALLNVLQAVIYIMDASRPFNEWLSKTVLGWTQFWKATAKAGDKVDKFGKPIGKTSKFLEKTRDVLTILGHILKNLFGTFKGIGKAGYSLGHDLLKSFERMTKGWSDWTNSVEGQNSLKEWFDTARPVLHEFGLIIGDLVKGWFNFGKTTSGANAKILHQIRTELLPALGKIMTALSTSDFASNLVDALTKVAALLANLIGDGGGLTTAAKVIGDIADAALWISKNVPGASVAINGLVSAFAALAAIRFVGAITGLSKLVKLSGKVAKKRGAAKAAAAAEGGGSTIVAGPGKHKAAKKPGLLKKIGKKGLGLVGLGGGAAAAGEGAAAGGAAAAEGGAAAAGGIALGPIVAVVAAVAALAIGVTVLYKKWKPFQDFVKKTGSSLKSNFLDVWKQIKPVLKDVAQNVLEKIKGAFHDISDSVHKNLLPALQGLFDAFAGGKKKFGPFLDGVMKIGKVAGVWLLKTFIKVAGFLTGNFFQTLGETTSGIIQFVSGIIKMFTGLVKIVKGIFTGDWSLIWDGVKTQFSGLFDALKGIAKAGWAALKGTFMRPVEFIVNTVLGGGIIGSINKVLDFLHLPRIPFKPIGQQKGSASDTTENFVGKAKGFARGGTVPGSGNRDSVPAMLMPGEFVLRKDAVRKIGVSTLHTLNDPKSTRRFARGGSVKDKIFQSLGGAASKVGNLIGNAIDLSRTGAAKGLELLFAPVRALMSRGLPKSGLGDMAGGALKYVMDSAVGFVRGNSPDKKAQGGKSQGVSSLLTPGEFVFNAQAARRIGYRRLERMNRMGRRGSVSMNPAHFNRGGPVARMFGLGGSVGGGFDFGAFAPSVSRIPTRAMPGVSSARLAAVSAAGARHYTYAPTINNPLPERASRSTQKALKDNVFENGWAK